MRQDMYFVPHQSLILGKIAKIFDFSRGVVRIGLDEKDSRQPHIPMEWVCLLWTLPLRIRRKLDVFVCFANVRRRASLQFACGKLYGVAAIQLAAGNSPPDCCIWSFRVPSRSE